MFQPSKQHKIALIHAVYPAMAPVEDSFVRLWPEAQRWNVVDDGLPGALTQAGELNESIQQRINKIAHYAIDAGAEGILFTCSAFGPCIKEAARQFSVPVLKPDEPMFEAALAQGRKIGMVATFLHAVTSTEGEFRKMAAIRNPSASLKTICVEEALAAAKAGDIARHNELVVAAAERHLSDCDVIMLAHFSTAPALALARERLKKPVFSAPDAAVLSLRAHLGA